MPSSFFSSSERQPVGLAAGRRKALVWLLPLLLFVMLAFKFCAKDEATAAVKPALTADLTQGFASGASDVNPAALIAAQ